MGRYTGKKCRLLTMLGLTALLFLVEIVVGYVTNSMALIADSFHMLSDVAALVVAFLSVKVRVSNIIELVLKNVDNIELIIVFPNLLLIILLTF